MSAIELETELAAAHWDRVRSRDSSLTHNPMDSAGLAELLTGELLQAWLSGLQADADVVAHVVVKQPTFLGRLGELLTDDRLPQWKDWLSWRAIRSAAALSTQALVDENFDFYGRTLSGTPELRPRWKRGVSMVESAVGEALGKIYVERTFPPEAKTRMDQLVGHLLAAYRIRIAALPVDGRGDQAAGAGEVGGVQSESGLPAEVPGLRRPGGPAG